MQGLSGTQLFLRNACVEMSAAVAPALGLTRLVALRILALAEQTLCITSSLQGCLRTAAVGESKPCLRRIAVSALRVEQCPQSDCMMVVPPVELQSFQQCSASWSQEI